MAFMIRSRDGRLTICTFDAASAAVHLKKLRMEGRRVRVTDVNGVDYRLGDLLRRE